MFIFNPRISDIRRFRGSFRNIALEQWDRDDLLDAPFDNTQAPEVLLQCAFSAEER